MHETYAGRTARRGDAPTPRAYKFARARRRNVTPSGVCFARAELARENGFRGPTLVDRIGIGAVTAGAAFSELVTRVLCVYVGICRRNARRFFPIAQVRKSF